MPGSATRLPPLTSVRPSRRGPSVSTADRAEAQPVVWQGEASTAAPTVGRETSLAAAGRPPLPLPWASGTGPVCM